MLNTRFFCVLSVIFCVAFQALGVNSKVVKHSSLEDFSAQQAQTDGVIITSEGKIKLARQIETLAEDFNDSWVINALAVDKAGVVYMGTSPNGAIYKYDGNLTKIYQAKVEQAIAEDVNSAADANDPNDPNNTAKEEIKPIANKHIFAMTIDSKGRLLAGVSGDKAELLRYNGKEFENVFEVADANYIFAIAEDKNGDVYLGTGPDGNIYKLSKNKKGYDSKVLYNAKDKNILSLAVDGGFIYAGSDERGLVYKINTQTGDATVLFDSDETEITAIAIDENGNVYAASTSAEAAMNQAKNSEKTNGDKMPGRKPASKNGDTSLNDGLRLEIANLKPDEGDGQQRKVMREPSAGQKGPASHIYKISKTGVVTDVYSKVAVFFAMEIVDGDLMIGSGNEAELFRFNPATDEDAMYYQDSTASQILAIKGYNDELYVATGNPARLLKVGADYNTRGEYLSSLIDAGQPARWGKLQVEADVPAKTNLYVQGRTGNVAEANDSSFSQWTDAVKVTEPVQLNVPRGRFCQYKVIFETDDTSASPVLDQAAVAYVIDNIAPKVTAVTVEADKENRGVFKIGYKAEDDNEDTLIYTIEMKKAGYRRWIEIEKDYDKDAYTWDSRTVEDGRYEIKITASDKMSNNSESAMTDSRISDVFVVDNSPAEIKLDSIARNGKNLNMKISVEDKLSIIDNLQYTINSSEDWRRVLPMDMVYDTLTEKFDVNIGDLEPGVCVIAFKASDAAGNVSYKSVEVNAE